MKIFILIFLCLLNILKTYDAIKIVSYEEKSFSIKNDYIIYEYFNAPKDINFPGNNYNTKKILNVVFKNGKLGYTYIYIYNDLNDIKFDDTNKFSNYNYKESLNYQNIVSIPDVKTGKIYILIYSYNTNTYEDTITVYNNLEYYDITKFGIYKYHYEYHLNDDQKFISFSINNNNLNYSYFHYQTILPTSYPKISHLFVTEDNILIETNNNYTSFKDYKNKIIYLLIIFSSTSSIDVLFTTSNYSLISNLDNNIYYTPVIGSTVKYLFVDISKTKNLTNFNINHKMDIQYYLFEINDLETIEKKIPFIYIGKTANIKDLSFSIERIDEKYIGLVLQIFTNEDIYLSADYSSQDEEQEDFYDIIKINSYNETEIYLSKEKKYVIFEYLNDPKGIKFSTSDSPENFSHIYFRDGNQINTKINIYLNKKDIKLENNKFINSFYDDDLYNKKRICLKQLKTGKIYIVISNFNNDIYEDAITIFNNMEYYDISKIDVFRFGYYFNISSSYYNYISFRINNTNLDYDFFHYFYDGTRAYFITDEGKAIDKKNDYISLKDNKNLLIYVIFYYYSSSYTSILFRTSNYSVLYPLSDLENKTFIMPILDYSYTTKINLFIDISKFTQKTFFKVNQNMKIKYYLFETNDFETIEKKIPFSESGVDLNINSKNYDNFPIYRNNTKYIGLVLEMSTKKDIFLSIVGSSTEKINSFNETNYQLNNSKGYIIYEFSNEPKNINVPGSQYDLSPTLHIVFKNGNNKNTNIYIYYDKRDIEIENNKFIGSSFEYNLDDKNKIWIEGLKSGKIYIVISNFADNTYEDSITMFNNMEYYDITKINYFKFDLYFNEKRNIQCYNYISFIINNKNLSSNYFHYQDISDGGSEYHFYTEENILEEGNNFISLKENKNQIIYLLIIFSKCPTNIPILFKYSNYSLLYPLSDIVKRTFFEPIIDYTTKYLFIDITNCRIFDDIIISINHEMEIKYFLLEINDFEEIEKQIPFLKDGENAVIEDLKFIIDKNDNKYKGLVLEIKTNSDINLSVDFVENEEKKYDIKNKIYSFEEKEISLDKDNQFIIYEYINDPKNIIFPDIDNNKYKEQILYMVFEGERIGNTYIDIYYNKDNIIIKNNYFINSNYSGQPDYNNRFSANNLNQGKIYIVISNFYYKSFKSKLTIFNNMEYYDISNKDIFKYNFYFSSNKEYITFKINSANIKNNFFHFEDDGGAKTSYHFVADNGELIENQNNYISLKDNRNRIIYFIVISYYQNINLLFTTSNYGLLSNLENNKYSSIILGTRKRYLFIDTSHSENLSVFKINKEIKIKYYTFEINDLETIEKKIPFINKGKEVVIKDLSFSIEKIDEKYIGLVLEMESNSNIELSVDFRKKDEEESEYKEVYKLYSYQKTQFKLSKDKNFIIYEFLNDPKEINNLPQNSADNYLFLIFEKGFQINTKINIYYSLNDIKLENNKFNNSFYEDDLYNKNKTWVLKLKSGKIYIVISNFQNDIYEDAITVFNNMEFYDISNRDIFENEYYFKTSYYNYVSFKINNTNLNYNYFHYYGNLDWSFLNEEGQTIKKEDKFISLKNSKNLFIYVLGKSSYTHFNVLFTTSNYSLLYPISTNRTFSSKILEYTTKYLFVDISEYPRKFYVNVNNKNMRINYYLFDTNNFETIENKIPFSEKGTNVNLKDLNFEIDKGDNKTKIGLVLELYTNSDISLSIDFNSKKESGSSSGSGTALAIIIPILIIIVLIVKYFYYKRRKTKEDYEPYIPTKKYKAPVILGPIYEKEEIKISIDSPTVGIYNNNNKIKNTNIISGNNNTITNKNTVNQTINTNSNNTITNNNITNNKTTNNYNNTNITNNNITNNTTNTNSNNKTKTYNTYNNNTTNTNSNNTTNSHNTTNYNTTNTNSNNTTTNYNTTNNNISNSNNTVINNNFVIDGNKISLDDFINKIQNLKK